MRGGGCSKSEGEVEGKGEEEDEEDESEPEEDSKDNPRVASSASFRWGAWL